MYAHEQLLPAARVPGFAFHQTERNAPNGTLVMSPYRRRDFDLLGYRYSLLSTIGTAGLNNARARAPPLFLPLSLSSGAKL